MGVYLRYNNHMLVSSFVSWWYGTGYRQLFDRIQHGLANLVDQFSILELIATLFSPFKQIDAGKARASVSADIKFRLWADRQFSRVFGAFIRFFTIIAGVVVLLLALIVGCIRIVLWPLVPLLPIAGLVLALMGWLPWI